MIQVGCGGISRLWLDALRDSADAEVVGFVDLDSERANDAALRVGSPAPTGSDLRAMLTATWCWPPRSTGIEVGASSDIVVP